MKLSDRTSYIVERLAVSIMSTVEQFIVINYENRYLYQLIIDEELNVSSIYGEEAVENDKYDMNLSLDNFIEIECEDDEMFISVNEKKCYELAEKYGPLIEYGAVNVEKFL